MEQKEDLSLSAVVKVWHGRKTMGFVLTAGLEKQVIAQLVKTQQLALPVQVCTAMVVVVSFSHNQVHLKLASEFHLQECVSWNKQNHIKRFQFTTEKLVWMSVTGFPQQNYY